MKSNLFSHSLGQPGLSEKLWIFNKDISIGFLSVPQTHKSIPVCQPLYIYQVLWVDVTANCYLNLQDYISVSEGTNLGLHDTSLYSRIYSSQHV